MHIRGPNRLLTHHRRLFIAGCKVGQIGDSIASPLTADSAAATNERPAGNRRNS
jgi:hypothetical protein